LSIIVTNWNVNVTTLIRVANFEPEMTD